MKDEQLLAKGFSMFRKLVLGDKCDETTVKRMEEAFFAGALNYDNHLIKSNGLLVKELSVEARAYADAKVKECDEILKIEARNN